MKNQVIGGQAFDTVVAFLAATTLVYANSAYALTADLSTMAANFSQVVPQLMALVTAVAFVMGMLFVFKGLLELKQYGEQRSMMSERHSVKGPVIFILVGAALLYLPSSVHVGMSTFWSTPAPYAYANEQSNPWTSLINNIFLIIQLIGTISFIRGLVILTHIGGHHGGQPGTLGRAIAHLVAGVFCINMYQFVQAVVNTLALGQL